MEILFIMFEIQLTILLYHPAIVNVDKLENVSCYGSSDGFIMLDVMGTSLSIYIFPDGSK